MTEAAHPERPEPDSADYLPALEAALRYFGKSADREALLAGLPLKRGRLGGAHLAEAASRAEIIAVNAGVPAAALTRTQMPALAVSIVDGAVALLIRRGSGFMAAQGDGEPFWVPDHELEADVSVWQLRPAFYFDQRSNLLDIEPEKDWFKGALFANRRLYAFAILAGLFVNLAAIAISLFTMAVYDRVIPNNATASLTALAIGISVVVLTDVSMRVIRGYLVDVGGRRFDVSVGARIFRQLLALRGTARPQSAGTLANTVREFETVRDFFTSATLVGLGDLPFVALFLIIIWWVGGSLVLVPIAAIMVVVGAGFLLQKPIARAVSRAHREAAHKSAFLHETMAGIDTLKAVNAQAWARRHWEAMIAQNAETAIVSRQWSSLSGSITAGAASFVTIFTVVFGALLVGSGDITSGALIAAVILSGRAVSPFAQVANLMARWQQTKLAVEGLDKFMQAPIEETPGQIQKVAAKGALTFRDVRFSYPSPGEDIPPVVALDGIDIHVEPGTSVAILGRVGSGKSTALRLALNLNAPDAGHVLLDGVDVRQIHPAALRTAIGYAGQEAVLFHGTIRDNILAAHPGLADERLLEVVRAAGLDELLSRSVLGLQTQVGEGGARLSGGERQAVSLARAIAGRPPVLLLDEPTSAMDNTTEQRVLAGLARDRAGLTTVIVTHKPALLPLVSRVVVLDRGRVAMDGPRDKVLAALTGKEPRNALNVVTGGVKE
ncbi:type I secretion system permease/ATPase [Parvibaculum sp.]|jgi:ATP-binding cassette, subfamily C, bacterial LapB|uniref:type I secretion system permease/ATPase n=1 Tax=Parvibaculum sp. TaxID=2024848 RepID=UPI000C670A19|nr:type I secretion system permease/ATPase [Parvibaculum sp.]MAM95653.1 type I secretion system permease/ATPase [Parvibaculum sp.]|tara:strand:- start:13070 stop:15238 length:2169 start_codon:yes stop_codon:yes gene_type:complete